MSASIEGNRITFDGDDEVYDINTKKCNIDTYVDDNGQRQVFFPVKEREIKPKAPRKRKPYVGRKTAKTPVVVHIRDDFKHMKLMTAKQLAGLNYRYITIKENIRAWSLNHPHSDFCYYKLSKEPIEDYERDREAYVSIPKAIKSCQAYLCGEIDRYLEKLRNIYEIKLNEETVKKRTKAMEILKRVNEKIKCDCGGQYSSTTKQNHEQHLITKRHLKWIDTYTQANNEAPRETAYIELTKLRENTSEVVYDDTDDDVEEAVEKINDEELNELEDDDYDELLKGIDELKKVVEEKDYTEEEETVDEYMYKCMCGMKIPLSKREEHFKSAEHFDNISESEPDEDIDDEPTENVILAISEPISCC